MKKWMLRQSTQMNCSPALGVLAIIVVMAITCYVYRQVILTTIETAVLAAVGVAVFTGVIAVTISTLRWYRKRQKAMAADPSGATAMATLATDKSVAQISAEADLLAQEGTEMVFAPDGSLHVKK
jgi:hypothetical protein